VLPLLLNRLESQEVVVHTYAAVALDRILSMRPGGSTTLMYACPLPPVASPSSSNCAGSHPRTCNRSRHSFSMSSSLRSASNKARSARQRTTFSCVVRVPFVPCVLVPDQCLSRCCESHHHGEAGSRRGVHYCSPEARRHPPQSRPKSE
jgi:hypothetical protein